MKVYFDQNVWQLVINKFPASAFRQKLNSKDISICLGMDNIYEFARCFLDGNDLMNIEKGKEIFKYLRDLDICHFLKPTNELIISDLVYARAGGKLLPYLDEYNTIATKEEISRLANGWYDRAQKFIQNREESLTKSAPQYRAVIIKANQNIPRPKDFDELRMDWRCRRAILNQSKFGKEARFFSNSTLFSEPGKYPYLNTYVNAQLYLNFIALTNPTGPSKKSTSDYRHLIAANAADCFVTEDEKVQRNSQKLCPYLNVYNWDEFENRIKD